jgi:serine kinase of HPr protein (carbohydrate metabolism regulator)
VIRHGGLVALRDGGLWRGVLIEGPSGSGKSDLALRCLDAGFRLVADDRVIVWTCEGRLYGRAPDILAGLIEARHLGIVREPALVFAEIAVLVRCVSSPQAAERMPDLQAEFICGAPVSALDLWPLEPSAPVKLRRAISHIGQAGQGAYQAPLAARP